MMMVLRIDADLAQEAFEEALRRYPDAHGALIFLYGASGLGQREPTPEQLEWARKRMSLGPSVSTDKRDPV